MVQGSGDLGLVLALRLTCCVALGELLLLSESMFPQPRIYDPGCISFLGLL